MSFIGNLNKIFAKDKEHYVLFTEIINKLQPIAFLISASLVLAVFFDAKSISRIYALFASLSFFLAYMGFAFYIKFNYRLSFYWGLGLTLISAGLIYESFGDALAIILSVENPKITILATYIVQSIFFLIARYLLDKSNENNRRYKISNYLYSIAGLIILIYVPVGIFLNLPYFPILFADLLLIVIIFISFNNSKETKNRWREDEDFSYQ